MGQGAGEGSFAIEVAPAGPDPAEPLDSAIPSGPLGDTPPVTDAPTATIGLGPLRPAPAGLPDPAITPPTIAESGDPFTTLRVIDLAGAARAWAAACGWPTSPTGSTPRYLDWLFPVPVVADVVIQLQAELDGRLPEQLGHRRRGRPDRADR